ncbi:MAG: radical SAM protein [Candidatus Aenigmatarchaeota archaeon]
MTEEMKTFILETNSSCNLDCDYCYADKEEEELELETIDDFIHEYKGMGLDRVELLWLGGESLLRDIEFYEKAFNKLNNSDLNVESRVQTNATLINEEWARIFDGYDLDPGVSLDGPSYIHDKNRKYKNGEGSFDTVIEKIKYLRERGIEPGGISVVTKDSVGNEEEIYEFFKELNMNPSFNVVETDVRDKQLTQNEYFSFFKKMYDVWSNDENRNIQITPLKEIAKSFFGSKLRLCDFSDCSDNCISITDGGSSYLCAKFNRMEDFKLGNIKEGIQSLYDKKSKLIDTRDDIDPKFLGCHYMNLMVNGDINDPAYLDAKKELFNYIHSDLEERL